MIRTVVVGLGLEGLVAGWVFRQHPNIETWIVGAYRRVEGVHAFTHTESIGNLLRELDVPHASFSPRDGILLRGTIEPYPACFREMERDDATRVCTAWLEKAHLEAGRVNGELRRMRCAKPRRIRCNLDEFACALNRGARIVRRNDWRLEPGALVIGPHRIPYDFAVLTESVRVYRDRVWFKVPNTEATQLATAFVVPRDGARFRRWDRVLTPFTPGGALHTVRASENGCAVSFSGTCARDSFFSDLNFLFPDGYDLRALDRFEQPAATRPRLRTPENVAALGRDAEWLQSVEIDSVLDRSYDLMRRWLR